MQFPLSWLKELISLHQSPDEIAQILTSLGIEVEKFYPVEFSFEGVVVAKVVEARPHPNADKLRLATVTDGTEQYEIVCGAPNCRTGMKTALARIGAELKFPDGEVLKIKKSKLRGEESHGMLCSAEELQLSDSHDGIIEFSEEVPLGIPLTELYADYIFEVGLTPNLGHCFSLQGIARELFAATQIPLKSETIGFTELDQLQTISAIKVEVQDQNLCRHYTCRFIKGVKVGPSPLWLKSRLHACGLRSINNVVDATNYVLMELGHPLHAFDYDQIAGHKIVVRKAAANEPLKTLDEVERVLPEGALVIADAEKPLAVAGVMGGANSAVNEKTVNILLESAHFDSVSIRRTSKALGLSTDASKRFERGVDLLQLQKSLDRVAQLIQLLAGGEVAQGIVEVRGTTSEQKVIECRIARVNQILGTDFNQQQIKELLERLEFKCTLSSPDRLQVSIPFYRNDVTEEIDLIEDVARIYGYTRLPRKETFYQGSTIAHTPLYMLEKAIKNQLVGQGMYQLMTCDLISPQQAELCCNQTILANNLVKICNPSSIDQSVLRPSLLAGLLQVVKHNASYQNNNNYSFEVGRIYRKKEELYIERSVLGVILSGQTHPSHWEESKNQFDFFNLKGIVENLFERLSLPRLNLVKSDLNTLHPGGQGILNLAGQVVGYMGEVHPLILKRADITTPVLYAEIDLMELLPLRQPRAQMKVLPQFPGSERDWTISMPESLAVGQFLERMNAFEIPYLENVILKDIYRSTALGPDKKNVTFRFTYRNLEQTLSFDQVEQAHQQVLKEAQALIVEGQDEK